MSVCLCVCLQQTKAKYEIEAEKRELARLLEKRTQEVENLTGKISDIRNLDTFIFIYTTQYHKCASRSFTICTIFPQTLNKEFYFKLGFGLLCVFAEDVKHLNEKLTETSKVKMELQLKLDEIQSSAASVQVRTRPM